jgi:hypothetical protein
MWALVLLACAPAPMPAGDLGPRVLAEPRPVVCPESPEGPLDVTVRAEDAAGLPLAGARVGRQDVPGGAWVEVGRTGADGALTVPVVRAPRFMLLALPTDPGDACPAAPTADGPAPLVLRVTTPVCPLNVDVVDISGAPVAAATVGFGYPAGDPPFRTAQGAATTDAAGRADAVPLPCALQLVSASAPDGRVAAVDVSAPSAGDTVRVVLPAPTAWLEGTVATTTGTPVPDAEVWVTGRAILTPPTTARASFARHGTRVRTDATGAYHVGLTPAPAVGLLEEPFHVEVLAEGFGDTSLSVGVAVGAGARRDIVVDAYPRVHARCAGRPGDSCADLYPLACTVEGRASTEEEEVVFDDVIHRAVLCPPGIGRTVRLGPVEAIVGPDQNVAWLDFRGFGGGVRGRIATGGADAVCFPSLVPTAQSRLLARDRVVGVVMEAAADGTFSAEHLPPGTYVFAPGCRGGEEAGREVEIDEAVVDLGVVSG